MNQGQFQWLTIIKFTLKVLNELLNRNKAKGSVKENIKFPDIDDDLCAKGKFIQKKNVFKPYKNIIS
jgi:hypothetical protein